MVHFVHHSTPATHLSVGRLNLSFLPKGCQKGTKRVSNSAQMTPFWHQLITHLEVGPPAPVAHHSWSKPAKPAKPALTRLVNQGHLWGPQGRGSRGPAGPVNRPVPGTGCF